MSILIENLSHVYNSDTVYEKKALVDINLEIKKGEFIGIIGHTGSGKSTLIQHLNGLIKPDFGTVSYEGEDIHKNAKRLPLIRQKIGLVFQYPEHQLFEMTVFLDVSFGPKNMGLPQDEIDERVKWALGIVGISEDLYEKSPFELSGGQKRRVAIAGVLAMKPDVLVLDEPTAGLDPKARDELFAEIKKLHEELNITIILVSHSMEDIAKLVERLIVLENGAIRFSGSPVEVFQHKEELEKIGVTVPQITDLLIKLNEKGFKVSKDIFTVEEASKEILNALKQVKL